jgi:hypothetical protein
MKLLYTSGQFLFNEKWPETPKKVECVSDTACLCAKYAMRDGANRDVVDYYDENCPHRYQSALSQAIKEAVVVEELPDGFYRAVLQSKGVSPDGFIDDLFKEGSFYELPEGWTVRVFADETWRYDDQGKPEGLGSVTKTAKVLPVEVPVSEGKEDEQEKIWNEIYDEILWYGVESSELMKRYHITRKSLPSK